MAWLFKTYRWYVEHIIAIKVSLYAGLLISILGSYAGLVLLFLCPEVFNNVVFLYSDPKNDSDPLQLSPQVLVSALAIIVSGATVTLVTRCVEETLWVTFSRSSEYKSNSRRLDPLTVAESFKLAQWSISSAARIQYLFVGGSYLLRIAGISVLLTSVISPILLSGITQEIRITDIRQVYEPHPDYSQTVSEGWAGFHSGLGYLEDIAPSNGTRDPIAKADYWGVNAFMSTIDGVSPPIAQIWNTKTARELIGNDGNLSTVLINARTPGFHTECKTFVYLTPEDIPDSMKYASENFWGERQQSVKHCTSHFPNDEVGCVDIDLAPPSGNDNIQLYRRATFRSYAPADNLDNPLVAFENYNNDGNFTSIVGIFWNLPPGKDENGKRHEYQYHTVDCQVKYGWVNITQNGSSHGMVIPDSYQVSSKDELNISVPVFGIYGGGPAASQGQTKSAWNLFSQLDQYGKEMLLDLPLGLSLLGPDDKGNSPTAEYVASRIVKAWNGYNIYAFARNHTIGDVLTTIEIRRTVYIYDARVLLCLLIPLIAVLAGCWDRWWIGDNDVVLGYDPVGIARLGPVEGLSSRTSTLEDEYYVVDNLKVGTYSDRSQERFRILREGKIPPNIIYLGQSNGASKGARV